MNAPASIVVWYLPNAVVVAGDRAGADVGLRADRRVAEVREVVGLRAGHQVRLLGLDEVAEPRVLVDPACPGRQCVNGPISARAPITASGQHRVRLDVRVLGDLDVGEHRAGVDPHAIADARSCRAARRWGRARRPCRAGRRRRRCTSVAGSTIVTPPRIHASLIRRRAAASTAARSTRSLIPATSVNGASIAVAPPRAAACATRSVRYSSPLALSARSVARSLRRWPSRIA